jgi:hypothetical protein
VMMRMKIQFQQNGQVRIAPDASACTAASYPFPSRSLMTWRRSPTSPLACKCDARWVVQAVCRRATEYQE